MHGPVMFAMRVELSHGLRNWVRSGGLQTI